MRRYLWLTLAENPAKAKFLTPAERIWLQRRNAAQKVGCCYHVALTLRGLLTNTPAQTSQEVSDMQTGSATRSLTDVGGGRRRCRRRTMA